MQTAELARYKEKVEEAAQWIRQQAPFAPECGLLTGTGLGAALENMAGPISLDYNEIPHFPVSTVTGHHGRLVLGTLAGKKVAALQGRFHLYEGYTPKEITFSIRVLAELGVRSLVMANATGGLNPDFSAGDIMIIADHINLTGENPLRGPNVDEWGERFPEMHNPYDPELIDAAEKAGAELSISLQKGVYAGLVGPSLETPAEMKYLRLIGSDCVGFSTVNETIVANHAGIRVLGFAVITNMNVPGALTPSALEDIIACADRAAPKVAAVVQRVLESI